MEHTDTARRSGPQWGVGQSDASFPSSCLLSLPLPALPKQLSCSASAGLLPHRDAERELRLTSVSGVCCTRSVCPELQEVQERQSQVLPSPEPRPRLGAPGPAGGTTAMALYVCIAHCLYDDPPLCIFTKGPSSGFVEGRGSLSTTACHRSSQSPGDTRKGICFRFFQRVSGLGAKCYT